MVKVGDRIVVQNMPYPAYVESVWFDPETHRTVINVDWKEHGKSKVYAHDENKTWHKYVDLN